MSTQLIVVDPDDLLQVDVAAPPGRVRSDLLEQSRQLAWKGEPAEIASRLRAYADAGVSHVQLWVDPSTPDAVSSFGDVLAGLDG